MRKWLRKSTSEADPRSMQQVQGWFEDPGGAHHHRTGAPPRLAYLSSPPRCSLPSPEVILASSESLNNRIRPANKAECFPAHDCGRRGSQEREIARLKEQLGPSTGGLPFHNQNPVYQISSWIFPLNATYGHTKSPQQLFTRMTFWASRFALLIGPRCSRRLPDSTVFH